jgi:hypothetical protein
MMADSCSKQRRVKQFSTLENSVDMKVMEQALVRLIYRLSWHFTHACSAVIGAECTDTEMASLVRIGFLVISADCGYFFQ